MAAINFEILKRNNTTDKNRFPTSQKSRFSFTFVWLILISPLIMMNFVRQNINFLCSFRMRLNFVTAHLCDARWPSHNFYGVPPRPSCFRQPVQRVRNARSYGMPRWHLYSFVSHPFFIFLFLPSVLRLQLPPRGKGLSHSLSLSPSPFWNLIWDNYFWSRRVELFVQCFLRDKVLS